MFLSCLNARALQHDLFFGKIELPEGFSFRVDSVQKGLMFRTIENTLGLPNIEMKIGGEQNEKIPDDGSGFGFFERGSYPNGVEYYICAPRDLSWVYFSIPSSGPVALWAVLQKKSDLEEVLNIMKLYQPRPPFRL
jgi:hypothetical protein